MFMTKLGGTAAIAITGLALTGCGLIGPESDETPKLSVDGDFVYAPAAEDSDEESTPSPATEDTPDVGDLFTMTIKGTDVTVSKQSCVVDADGTAEPRTDVRETAFGELDEANSDTTAPIAWLEAGAFASEDKSELTMLSDDMVKVGDKTFFAAEGDQGSALSEQFTDGCQTPDDDEDEGDDSTTEPTEEPSAPTAEPSEAGGGE